MITLKDIILKTNDDSKHVEFTDIHVEEGKEVYNTTFKVHIKNHMFDVISEPLTIHSKHLVKFLHELSGVYFNQQGQTILKSLEENFEVTFKYSYGGYIGVQGFLNEPMGNNRITFDYALEQKCFKEIKGILKETVLLIK